MALVCRDEAPRRIRNDRLRMGPRLQFELLSQACPGGQAFHANRADAGNAAGPASSVAAFCTEHPQLSAMELWQVPPADSLDSAHSLAQVPCGVQPIMEQPVHAGCWHGLCSEWTAEV